MADNELNDDLTKEELLANLLQGLKEALCGEIHSIDTLWDGIDDEPETSSV